MSWLRHGDTHLLTVGLFTFTLLDRFSAIHRSNSEDWVLEIRNTQHSDQGRSNKVWVRITLSLCWNYRVTHCCICNIEKSLCSNNDFYSFHIIILDIIPLPQKTAKSNHFLFILFPPQWKFNLPCAIHDKNLHALEQYWQVQVLIIIILGVSHIVCKEKGREKSQYYRVFIKCYFLHKQTL